MGGGWMGEDATLDLVGLIRCHDKVMSVMEWFEFGNLVALWQWCSLPFIFASLGTSLSRKGCGFKSR